MNKIEWLRDVLYIIPLAVLIWKAATMACLVEKLKGDMNSCFMRIRDMDAKIETNRQTAANLVKEVADALQEIKITVTRIETKLEVSHKEQSQ